MEKEFITSVSDYIQKITEINKRPFKNRSYPVSSEILYRGQSNEEWKLIPRLYRENLFPNENSLIMEFLRIAPVEFSNMSYFDKLVKMQHYGLPTRLIDTTLNPLVALYFACYGEKERLKDGVVYIIDYPVFGPNVNDISIIMKYIFEYGSPLYIDEFTKDVIQTKELRSAGSSNYENQGEAIRPLVSVPFYSVLPTLNNPRIINQDGAFLLTGMKVSKVEQNPSTLNRMLYYFETMDLEEVFKKLSMQKLFIPSGKKTEILKDLELIGITRNKMFPELEYQAEFITNMMKNNPKIKKDK